MNLVSCRASLYSSASCSSCAAKELRSLPLSPQCTVHHCSSKRCILLYLWSRVVSSELRTFYPSTDQNPRRRRIKIEGGGGDLRMRFLSRCTCSNNKPPLLVVSLLVSPGSVYLQIKTHNYRSQVSSNLAWPSQTINGPKERGKNTRIRIE